MNLVNWMNKSKAPKKAPRTGPKVLGLTTQEAAERLQKMTGRVVTRQMVKDWSCGRTVVPEWILAVL
jgi:hypothetical protein